MIPFCWSKGGGSQESERELVVTRGTVRLVGAAVGTAEGSEGERSEGGREGERERDDVCTCIYTHNYAYMTSWLK